MTKQMTNTQTKDEIYTFGYVEPVETQICSNCGHEKNNHNGNYCKGHIFKELYINCECKKFTSQSQETKSSRNVVDESPDALRGKNAKGDLR